MLNDEFLMKYFLIDLRSKKEINFLELKQGSMSVAEYAEKFEELSRFCSYANAVGAESSKCIKFENGLCPEIKQFIGFHEIRDFPTLVNKCRIFYQDSKAMSSNYKMTSDTKGKGHERGKPYGVERVKRKL